MSDFPESNDQNTSEESLTEETSAKENVAEETANEESTVFSAPVEHKDKVPAKSGKKRIISIIAACLAVLILAGGTVAIIKLIPEMKDDETSSSVFDDITVVETDSKDFKSVTVTNSNGEFKLITKQIESTDDDGQTETTDYWCVDGVDVSKLSNTTMNSIVSAAASVTAIREITTKTPSECGFDNPKIKVKVESGSHDPYTILVGDESPDGLGSYLMLEGVDTIYVAPETAFSSFDFALIDLADKTSIPATTFTSDTTANKADDGSYVYFDSITLSGKLFPDMITIINNPQKNDSSELVQYLITTPTQRYANSENLTSIVDLFSKEITVSGACAFDINDKTLSEFGLDEPDAVVCMTINGEARTFRISALDDGNYAVVYDGATMIRKVAAGSFGFLNYKSEDLYYKNVFMNSINDIKSLKLNDGDGEIEFGISYEEDADSKKTYHITSGGKEITASYFQSFYAGFVGIQCIDFSVEQTTQEPEGKLTFTFNDGSETVIEFFRINGSECQYSLNGISMGKIPSSSYNKMIKNIKLVSQDKQPT